tara:strand:- start:398 stop:721 length:324 start_codon:yes stop_codon:yes gene_type:complete
MFNFRPGSGWNFEIELRCFIIFKRLESEGFPKGMQTDLCRVLTESTEISFESLKAKVGNYKSELGVTNDSNSSEATKYIASNFGHLSVSEAEVLLTGYLIGKSEAIA